MLALEPLNRKCLGVGRTWGVKFLLQMAPLPRSVSLLPQGSIVITKQKEVKLCTQADCRVFNVCAQTAQTYVFLPSWL